MRYWLPENHHVRAGRGRCGLVSSPPPPPPPPPQLVYAVLGIYLHLVAFALYRNGKAADKALEALPGPDMPDYTTREPLPRRSPHPSPPLRTPPPRLPLLLLLLVAALPVSSSLPEFGTAEWEALLATPEGPQALIDAGLAFLA